MLLVHSVHSLKDCYSVGHRNKRTNRNHPNHSIAQIGLNTEKASGDLRQLAVNIAPVRKDQLTMV